MPVKQPGEFELIKRLSPALPRSPRTVLGAGDDCAILERGSRRQLFTIDSMVEGVHFELKWFTPRQLGARALLVNLSDIAAMGGEPRACAINLGIREGLDALFFDRLYQGLGRAARRVGCDVVGGTITRSAQLTITIALLGEVARDALRRDTAREGDDLFVTGTLGDAALGWRIMAGKLRAGGEARKFLTGRFLAPPARLTAGRKLARMRPTPAAIDISDGLLQDLGHILERSGVGAEIELEAIPRSPHYRAVMNDKMDLALSGGEDYELLFCVVPGHLPQRLSRVLETPVHRIGRIVSRRQGLRLREPNGRLVSPDGALGWDQLSGKAAKAAR
jgi:thiamine-monophosphate kinase